MTDRPSKRIRRLALVAFWLALAFSLTMALLPTPPEMPSDRLGDKFNHMLAFATMAALAAVAFRRALRWRVAVLLSLLGALIEVLQSIPALHRDCDVRDWIADTLAIAVVTVICMLLDRRSGGSGAQ